MGLDMYLYKTKKIKDMTSQEYETVDDFVSKQKLTSDTDIDLEKELNIAGANELKQCIDTRGQYISWQSIFEEVGYWRKSNQIHNWFVDNVQGGEDECRPHLVSIDDLKKLRDLCNQVLQDPSKAPELLPTLSGFFFGGTEYDEWYFNDLKETINIIDKALGSVSEEDTFVYRSSW